MAGNARKAGASRVDLADRAHPVISVGILFSAVIELLLSLMKTSLKAAPEAQGPESPAPDHTRGGSDPGTPGHKALKRRSLVC